MLKEEIWKAYVEGHYQASTLGRIRSLDRVINGPHGPGTHTRRGDILSQTVNSKGYPTVVICWLGLRVTKSVHQVIAETFLDNPEKLPEVNHIDGNPMNNRVSNLEWSSKSNNQKHAYATGLRGRGEAMPQAKLKEENIPEIQKLLKTGLSDGAVGKLFGVTHGTIRSIRVGTSRKHVK